MSIRPITEVAEGLGLTPDEIELYGNSKAKVRLSALESRSSRPNGKLVLVSAISPTPAGEGKTTLSIGLAQGLCRLGCRAVAALREPSLGPVFGMKGCATGGGRAQLVPAEEINLHFTGDLHAIASANNLLAAAVDNHLHWGNALDLDPRAITWKRCLDMNDRALRHLVTGLGGKKEAVPRETAFEISAASEVMAILALATSHEDLLRRLERTVVGSDRRGEPVTAGQLQVAGAMGALLRDALKPNLVQTLEGTPAFVHAGPFGNIAHGCSSAVGTRLALKLADVTITEAGFGADLGAEKFLDIKARQAGLWPDAGVLLATVRSLKMHGGVPLSRLDEENCEAVRAGFCNLARHAENLRKYGLRLVVGINRFNSDTDAELRTLCELCADLGLPVAVADVWNHGGGGAVALAELVLQTLEERREVHPLYPDEAPLRAKIETVAREIYRAEGVDFQPAALDGMAYLQERGFGNLPVCIAKTQYSFSDNPKLLGAPTGHRLTVSDVKLSAGAGFVVVYTGKIMTMPGLPQRPGFERIQLTPEGDIRGLF
jgi:formate--tetrahydrofolate ligase